MGAVAKRRKTDYNGVFSGFHVILSAHNLLRHVGNAIWTIQMPSFHRPWRSLTAEVCEIH